VQSVTVDSSFRPPLWLRHRHAQSILPSISLRGAAVQRRALPLVAASEEWLLDCGDGVTLQAFRATQEKRGRAASDTVSVLLHGWEGSADSLYIQSLGQTLFEAGHDVVRLNLRDHGATHHLNRELFHSCRLPEVFGAVQRIAQAFPGNKLNLVGYSLGGNFMLRVGALAPTVGLDVSRIIAVSPVLDPDVTMTVLEKGLWIYHSYFVLKWSRSLERKQLAWPQHYDFRDLLRTRNLRAMTDELVRNYTEYPTMREYLAGYAITGSRLASLLAHSTIITALDDPIIPARDLERLARVPHLEVIATSHGGHCGFIEDLGPSPWIDRMVLRQLMPARKKPAVFSTPELQRS
jgi:predicted alpha/beta-fold hydrolase